MQRVAVSAVAPPRAPVCRAVVAPRPAADAGAGVSVRQRRSARPPGQHCGRGAPDGRGQPDLAVRRLLVHHERAFLAAQRHREHPLLRGQARGGANLSAGPRDAQRARWTRAPNARVVLAPPGSRLTQAGPAPQHTPATCRVPRQQADAPPGARQLHNAPRWRLRAPLGTRQLTHGRRPRCPARRRRRQVPRARLTRAARRAGACKLANTALQGGQRCAASWRRAARAARARPRRDAAAARRGASAAHPQRGGRGSRGWRRDVSVAGRACRAHITPLPLPE